MPPPASPKRGIAWRLFAVGAAVLVLLACGGGAVALTRLTGNDPKLANAGPVTSPTPTLTPLSYQEYRAMLTEVDTSMATAMQGVAGARNQPTIMSTAATLAATVRAGQAKLAVIAAPNEAVAAHRTLLRALNLFARVSQDTESAALSNQACTGAAAMTTISNSQGAALMRAAIQELAAVDPANPISIGAWVPAPITSQTRRLANGTFVKKGTRNGSGQFKIDNTNGTKDAAVSLATVGSKVSAFTVYVRAGSTFTVTGVKNNTYEFYMAGGVDWDPAGPGFTRDCAFSKNADPLKYASTSQQFNIWTMTLNPATPGNTRAEEVNPDEFPQ